MPSLYQHTLPMYRDKSLEGKITQFSRKSLLQDPPVLHGIMVRQSCRGREEFPPGSAGIWNGRNDVCPNSWEALLILGR